MNQIYFDLSCVKLNPTRRKMTRRVIENIMVIESEIICIMSTRLIVQLFQYFRIKDRMKLIKYHTRAIIALMLKIKEITMKIF